MDICSFLESKAIVLGEEDFPKTNISKNNWNVSKQIDLIIYIQGILMKNKNTIIPRIDSSIGKDVENFKVQVKKTTKNLLILDSKNNKSETDIYFLDEGREILDRAKRALNAINQNDYLDLIKRSMSNYEMCLGRADEGNLKLGTDEIYRIRTIKYISYNLIEHDLFNYIKRLKRRGYCGKVHEIIEEFVNKSDLTNNSVDYLRALCSYPIESMKVLNNYKIDSTVKLSNEWINEINLALKNDGKELI